MSKSEYGISWRKSLYPAWPRWSRCNTALCLYIAVTMYIRGPKQLRIQKISAWFKIVIKLGSSLSKSAIPVVGSRVSDIEVFVANQCEVERAAAAKPLWMICPLEIVDLL